MLTWNVRPPPRRATGKNTATFTAAWTSNAIAIEELQHFQLVALLKRRGIPFGQPYPSPWITGLMRSVRHGRRWQAMDHLICCALIEGRSCEEFQLLAGELALLDAELAAFYDSLVESEAIIMLTGGRE